MKNIFFLVSFLVIPVISSASYEIRTPLESKSGGILPNSSIIFKGNDNSIPEKKYTITCKGIIGSGASHWRMAPGTTMGNLYWNGALLAKNIAVGQDYINAEGVIYKRGSFIINQGAFDWYELCEYVEIK